MTMFSITNMPRLLIPQHGEKCLVILNDAHHLDSNECLKQKSKLQPKEVVIVLDREENEKRKLSFTFASETW